MKNKKILYVILSAILFVILVSSIYINFISKSGKGMDLLIIGNIFLGIGAAITTLFMGLKVFDSKKGYQILFIAFLELLLVLAIVCLNYVYGYGKVVNLNNYVDYMRYVSLEFNIYIYCLFIFVIGLLNLNSYISDKKESFSKNIENKKEIEA